MSPPSPYSRQVCGRNCIGPRAPASLALRTRPNADSTKLTAASTDQSTLKRRSRLGVGGAQLGGGRGRGDPHPGRLPARDRVERAAGEDGVARLAQHVARQRAERGVAERAPLGHQPQDALVVQREQR